MKRKFNEINESDSDDNFDNTFQPQRKRKKRRQVLVESDESDTDTLNNSLSLSPSEIVNDDDDDDESEWPCSKCTYLNKNIHRDCKMCSNKRLNDDILINTANKGFNKILTIKDDDNNNNNDDDDDFNLDEIDIDIDEDDLYEINEELLANIESEDNNFKTVRSTKKMRNGKNKNDKKPILKKQISIVDLTQDIKHSKISNLRKGKSRSKKKKKLTIGKPKNNGSSLNRKKQRTLPSFTKKTKKAKKEKKPKVSNINGPRSREKYFAQKKAEAQSLTPPDKNNKKDLNLDDISEESDCVIIEKSKQKSNNKHVKFILNDNDNDNDRICKQSLQTQQWIDKYAPHHINDLYLHKKKFNDIDKWFKDAFESLNNLDSSKLRKLKYVKSVLFLIGQSGIGKTSTIKCLCDKYNAKLLCYPTLDANTKPFNKTIWDNDDTHFMNFGSMNRGNRNIDIRDDSQMDKFEAFLNRSKRFGALSLFGQRGKTKINKRQVILIKELPFVGKQQYLYRFREIVEKMCNTTRNIVIFEITTELEGTRDDLHIFGTNIRSHSRVSTIRFNPINKTLMKKCLLNIISSENLKKYIININHLINDIVENEKGDLRNAIQTLQMRLVQLIYNDGDCDNKKEKSKNKKKNKNKKKQNKTSSLKCIKNVGGREETLSLFHSLGKVLYAKKEMEPEECIERADLDCITFNDLLFENFGDYFQHNKLFKEKSKSTKSLSNDTKMDEWGFEIVDNNDNQQSFRDEIFEKYRQTLDYFTDADICCQYYNKYRYEDTSTDLRSTINDEQFGSQLYPALYAASIGSRGYLISHDQPPIIKLPNTFSNGYKKGGGLNKIRGSTNKIVNNLSKELNQGFADVILPQIKQSNFGNQKVQKSEQYLNQTQLSLIRNFKCQPTSLYVEIFPMIANISNTSVQNEYGINTLCASMIRTSNWYSMKYETKQFNASRFDYLQQSLAYNQNTKEQSDNDNNDSIEDIEQFEDDDIFKIH